jgi:predicted GNAT family acetyltransferase
MALMSFWIYERARKQGVGCTGSKLYFPNAGKREDYLIVQLCSFLHHTYRFESQTDI